MWVCERIGKGRNRKSDQIRIAREVRDDIKNKLDRYDKFFIGNKYPNKGSLEEKSKWIKDLLRILNVNKAALGYFTLLVILREIDDPNILNYYKKSILGKLNDIDNNCKFIESEMKHDTDLEVSLTDFLRSDASSQAVNSFSVVAKIRRELLQQKGVWEHSPKRRIRYNTFPKRNEQLC